MQVLARRALGVLTIVLLAAVVAGGTGALAVSDPVESAGAFHGKSKNGVYIVRMANLPAVAYDGGVAGYKATKPKAGQKIDPNAPDVVRYTSYLKATHDEALGKVGGAQKLYDYTYSLDGFAAKLSATKAKNVASQSNVLSVEPDQEVGVDTISTPDFLGLTGNTGTWSKLGGVGNAGENLIIGDVDTGIWPENPEFSDRTGVGPNGQDGKLGYQQIPGWHGKCTPGEAFVASNCNQKLIGAQWFVEGHGTDTVIPEEYLSTRDFDGHGSHTASTVAGNNNTQVTGDLPAALLGKASGMAPRARIAAYKACWELPDHSQVSCFTSDTTAAIDQAVADGVDAINYSISGTATNFLNSVEVAFLFAEDAGVFVSASAGNSGPTVSTVAHPSPWITTVAASTHNRSFEGSVTLGNGTPFTGVAMLAAVPSAPLILASNAGLPGAPADRLRQCFSAATNGGVALLDPAKVAGKIVLCERGGSGDANARVDKPQAVKDAGGVGTIIGNVVPGASLNADIHVQPTIHVDATATDAIKAYATSTASPTAALSAGHVTLTAPAPAIAGFSSRGPSLATADQLKPDISAPGVDVLAAVAPPNHDGRNWDLESGTSMSAPHVAGLSLLIKQAHPGWTPDMVKSAMMTTATNLLGTPDAFAQGAGHVNPSQFLDPGLVYKSGGFNAYFAFLCGTGQLISAGCTGNTIAPNQLNLPSMAIGALAGNATLNRRVTNVASQAETYTASVSGLAGVNVAVSPSSFTVAPGATQAYSAAFTTLTTATFDSYAKGFITFTGNRGHVVRIPAVVRPVRIAAPGELTLTGSADKGYGIVTGYNGTLAYNVRGLVPGQENALTVPFDPAFSLGNPRSTNAPETDVTIAAGTQLARFSIFQSDTTGNDLDVYVYRISGTTLTLVGSSTGPTADEQVQLANPTAGQYAVFVDGFDTNGPSTTTKLFSWQLGSSPAGNMTATGPSTATIGGAGTVTLHFTGLAAGTRYLGAVDYSNGSTIGTTFVRVNN